MASSFDRFQSTAEFMLIFVIFAAVSTLVLYTSLKYGTVEKYEGTCVKAKQSSFFTFGWNKSEEQLKTLATMSRGTETFVRRMYTHFLKDFAQDNFVFSPSSIYITLALVVLNFQHDTESLLEIQRGGSLPCGLDILLEELKLFLSRNEEYYNSQLLHHSYDEKIDGAVGSYFQVEEFRDLEKFRATSDDLMIQAEFQTRLELEVNFGVVKMGFQNSGSFFSTKDDQNIHRFKEVEDTLTLQCGNGTIVNVDYLKSRVILCTNHQYTMKLFLPHSALAFEVLQSRFGGYDLFNIDAEVARGYFEHQGPLNLTLPNLDLDYSFELSRPLQSFGIIKMFNEGLSRKQYQENLIAADMWQRARFKMRHLQRAFKTNATNKEENSSINLKFNRPFFFSLTNIHSNVIQMFGLIMNHTSFYEEL